ncbi:MAG: hypothetical protein ACOVQT_10515, partial [Rubrivivax sp.]
MLTITMIGLLTPPDVLDSSPSAATFAAKVRDTLLSVGEWADIAAFANSTDYPQVALLVCALHWAFLPIHISTSIFLNEIYLYRFGWHRWRATRESKLAVTKADLKLLLVVPVLIAGLGVCTMMPGDPSRYEGLTTESRVGMSFMFFAAFWCAAVSIVASFNILHAYVRFNILKKTADWGPFDFSAKSDGSHRQQR